MDDATNLLERRLYGFSQVDRLLGLSPGTAQRWINGYERAGRRYPPVVRLEPSDDDLVTWGEFVETRLLSEYRGAGVPLVRMRPAVEALRDEFNTRYPLAFARPYASGRELVHEVQQQLGLERSLHLVVSRSGQLFLTEPADQFFQSAEFEGAEGAVRRLHPRPDLRQVVLDPLRQFGEPVVRSVTTEVLAEQFRAGESVEALAELYELPQRDVQAAIRYELLRSNEALERIA